MTKTIRVVARLGAAILITATLFGVLGCQLTHQTYLVVSIDVPAEPALVSVAAFEVTRLRVEVLDADGSPVDGIDWLPADGAKRFPVAVNRFGEYILEVTHFGTLGDETIEVTEVVTVGVVSMFITVIDIVPGTVEIGIDPGSGGPTYEEVQELLQLVYQAQIEIAPTLTRQELPDGTPVWANPDFCWILFDDQSTVFDDCSVSGSDIRFSGRSAVVSQGGTSSSLEIEAEGTTTFVGAGVETIETSLTISVAFDATGQPTSAVITGTAVADGVEFDLAGMGLGPTWFEGFLILMQVLS